MPDEETEIDEVLLLLCELCKILLFYNVSFTQARALLDEEFPAMWAEMRADHETLH